MFTGIVQHVGRVSRVRPGQGCRSVSVDIGPLAADASLGDSIAVDGACLTVADVEGQVATFDISSETLHLTTLGGLAESSFVNLEPALRLGDRLGGHFVSGHIDGIGTVSRLEQRSGEWRLEVESPRMLTEQMILKGSVCVSGISLTIAGLRPGSFEVSIIPHTLEVTTLGRKHPGEHVNLECDMIGRWVRRNLDALPGRGPSGLSISDLEEQGF